MTTSPRGEPLRAYLMLGIPCAVFLIAFFHRPAVGTVAKDLMSAFEGGGAGIG